MTIQEITRIEPRVKTILNAAAHARPIQPDNYSHYKNQLEMLVGWSAKKKELRTSEAYCTAIHALCDVLKI